MIFGALPGIIGGFLPTMMVSCLTPFFHLKHIANLNVELEKNKKIIPHS
jgi:hypothetical protein